MVEYHTSDFASRFFGGDLESLRQSFLQAMYYCDYQNEMKPPTYAELILIA